MKTFRSYQLALSFYRQAQTVVVPAHLRDQLLRAASSAVLNLAEGNGRRTVPDQRRFFTIAFGSIRECQAVLDLAPAAATPTLVDLLDHLAASVYKLIRQAG